MIEGLVGLTAMMLLCCLRMPISFAMAIVGFVGYAYMRDWNWEDSQHQRPPAAVAPLVAPGPVT